MEACLHLLQKPGRFLRQFPVLIPLEQSVPRGFVMPPRSPRRLDAFRQHPQPPLHRTKIQHLAGCALAVRRELFQHAEGVFKKLYGALIVPAGESLPPAEPTVHAGPSARGAPVQLPLPMAETSAEGSVRPQSHRSLDAERPGLASLRLLVQSLRWQAQPAALPPTKRLAAALVRAVGERAVSRHRIGSRSTSRAGTLGRASR